jgi:hypothetical protein
MLPLNVGDPIPLGSENIVVLGQTFERGFQISFPHIFCESPW